MTKMLKFVNLKRETPEKVSTDTRKDNFLEIYKEFINSKAKEQASRCSQCGTPFCQVHCPLQNNIPDWLKLTAEGRLKDAYEISSATNSMPEVCGSICPQDRLCEGNCVIEQSGHGTVTIGAVEKFITNTAWENGWVKPIKPLKELKQSVGIIGAGPAGIAAATELRKQGYQVTIYDRHDRTGGLLIYGIPNFKLDKSVVLRRTKLLLDSNIKIINNFEVGKSSTLKELKDKHDAILIATGVYKARKIDKPGSELKNIFPAMKFLTASNKKGLGDKVRDFDNGILNAEGKNVIVVGGGDTAMDCVRTAVRQKAKSVSCLYRRDKANMPGSAREVLNAEEEGVKFIWLSSPKVFKGQSEVKEVVINKMRLGEPDASGRQSPKIIEGHEETLKADLVIEALGFEPEDVPKLFNEPGLDVTKWGTIKVDLKTLKTNIKGVFAAGDIVRGASLVVWAIRDGKDAANGISEYLNQLSQKKIRAA
ncbi:MAG: dihydropyrimidine dehydrogenase [Candidatus Pelagibacter sp.]|nr:dihydropyrimidine dehydrogenase [Candidatus Pelagibacter sp.]|tara:strand:+ start:3576 stop:5012 length:1437 start_codon:yes stop_codon:yes gene_type:complete